MTVDSNPGQTISILIVEDEAITLELLITILGKKFPDFVIHTASNGRSGLELFKEHMPDIVITDINMPQMGGAQMAGKIRAIKPDTKFIVLAGGLGKLAIQDSLGKGFVIDHYVDKPVDFYELFDAIEQCTGEVLQH